MNINLQSGKYIVAVSGGVDSVTLLNMLSKIPNLQLVVAHFDHGIRKDSFEDKIFVEKLAAEYGLDFVAETVALGANASEEQARKARYDFLFKIMKEYDAKAIITAHHQDDVLETIIINLARGTGRKGLSPMRSRPEIIRPLLDLTKEELLEYAEKNKLQWREDSTNSDPKYFRNYVRTKVVPKMNEQQKTKLVELAGSSHKRNQEIDELIELVVSSDKKDELNREAFAALPHDVACEVLAHVLRVHGLSFDRKNIEKLVIALKTLPAGRSVPISGGRHFVIDKKMARISGI